MRKKVLSMLIATFCILVSSGVVFASTANDERTFEELVAFSGIYDDGVLENIYRVFMLPDDEIESLYAPFAEAFNVAVNPQLVGTFLIPHSLSCEICPQTSRFRMATNIVTSTPEDFKLMLVEFVEDAKAVESAMLTLESVLENVNMFDEDGNPTSIVRFNGLHAVLEEKEELTLETAMNTFNSMFEGVLFDTNGNSFDIMQIETHTEVIPLNAWRSVQRRNSVLTLSFQRRVNVVLEADVTRVIVNSVNQYVTFHGGGVTSPTHSVSLLEARHGFSNNNRTLDVLYNIAVSMPEGWVVANPINQRFLASEMF